MGRTKRKAQTESPAKSEVEEEETATKPAQKSAAPQKEQSKRPAEPKAAKKAPASGKPSKKAKVTDVPNIPVAPEVAVGAGAAASGSSSNSVIIVEASKECQCFKKRTEQLQAALKGIDNSISLSVNPEKPRKGTFELRSEGGKVLFSLTNMPRPFTKLKALDADPGWASVAEKVVQELKA